MQKIELTGLIQREGDEFVSCCVELDIASQGATVEEAERNLEEAVGLFFETASKTEIQRRLGDRRASVVTKFSAQVPAFA